MTVRTLRRRALVAAIRRAPRWTAAVVAAVPASGAAPVRAHPRRVRRGTGRLRAAVSRSTSLPRAGGGASAATRGRAVAAARHPGAYQPADRPRVPACTVGIVDAFDNPKAEPI